MHAIRTFALFLSLAASSARATEDVPPIALRPLLKERARGFVQLLFENKILREARLVFDGEQCRLLLAGLPTVLFKPEAARITVSPHPRARAYVSVYEWSPADQPFDVQLLVRPREVLEIENQALYGGDKHELPKLIVIMPNRRTALPEIQGALWVDGQDTRDVNALIKDMTEAGGQYVSFVSNDQELSRLEFEAAKIKVWR